MSERHDLDIEIKDLPAEETLTPEEKQRLAGAGLLSFRPSFEALEAREMMDAGLRGALLAPCRSPVTAPLPRSPTCEPWR